MLVGAIYSDFMVAKISFAFLPIWRCNASVTFLVCGLSFRARATSTTHESVPGLVYVLFLRIEHT